ncbi:MAG TPA: hypothetical protein VD833_15980 [Vicinamibacterales bacterium]|nr:hypothetical protein [Vicinamibacterales bacterium]
MSLEALRQAAIALLATPIDLVLRDRSLSGRGSPVGVPDALPR